MWEEVTDLRFSKRDSGSVHIEIAFEEYEHVDGDPFDGPGGTLAHAYFPQYGGMFILMIQSTGQFSLSRAQTSCNPSPMN